MRKRLTISLALLLAAMVLVFGDWAVSDETVPAWPADAERPATRDASSGNRVSGY
jgi:hypothetical protein